MVIAIAFAADDGTVCELLDDQLTCQALEVTLGEIV